MESLARTPLQPGPALPMLASVGITRRRLTPTLWRARLSGISPLQHIALTFDDGPDPRTTPHFLTLLAELDVRATFFVLGAHIGDGRLLRDMVADGHELGVHGWDHVATPRKSPGRIRDEVRRTRDLVEDVTGTPVHWYRPPYGVLTRSTIRAAHAAELEIVLWSAWGRDWTRGATPRAIDRIVSNQIRPGGTVLLHDTDRTSAPGSWWRTLSATRALLERWRDQDQPVGPLAEHWSGPTH